MHHAFNCFMRVPNTRTYRPGFNNKKRKIHDNKKTQLCFHFLVYIIVYCGCDISCVQLRTACSENSSRKQISLYTCIAYIGYGSRASPFGESGDVSRCYLCLMATWERQQLEYVNLLKSHPPMPPAGPSLSIDYREPMLAPTCNAIENRWPGPSRCAGNETEK